MGRRSVSSVLLLCAGPVAMLVLAGPWRVDLPAQAIGRNGMVATSQPLASQAGLRMLQQGGSAADAAVASAAVIAVTNPFMAGLGGVGGYALIYDAKTGKTEAIDFIGTAPKAATLEMFQGDRLWDFSKRATDGPLAPVVPGILAGWAAIHAKYGSLPWATVLEPAIEYAENGFPASAGLIRNMTTGDMSKPRRDAYGRTLFQNSRAEDLRPGELWLQKDLAATLRTIAEKGPNEFYRGEIAKGIARHFRDIGGLITESDLASYEVVWSEPISATYRGFTVSVPRPGSSGMTILQWLNALEQFDLEAMDRTDYVHTIVEVKKLGFYDDDRYNSGKPNADIPIEKLISKPYALQQAARIKPQEAQFYAPYSPSTISSLGEHTNHHTVIDGQHNIVTITQTLMYPSGVVVPGTGLILNNGMCYFSLESGDANRIEGGVRPRFVMSPTIVFRHGKPYFATGAAGGWTIPQTILQTILNVIDRKSEIGATGEGRFILRYLANSIPYVPGTELTGTFHPEVRKDLLSKGHRMTGATDPGPPGSGGGALNSILIDPRSGVLWGAGGAVTW
jgi:gamma-glutamyltranspeptidase / glutathione hydrolase